MVNDYTKLIQSIKKEYQKLALGNEVLKNKVKKKEKNRIQTIHERVSRSRRKTTRIFSRKKKKTLQKANSI